MLTGEMLVEHDGEQVIILGRKFTFRIESDLGGDWHTFQSVEDPDTVPITIWATLNYDMIGVPISIRDDRNDKIYADNSYDGIVANWAHYLLIVKAYVWGMLHGTEEAWWERTPRVRRGD